MMNEKIRLLFVALLFAVILAFGGLVLYSVVGSLETIFSGIDAAAQR